MTARHRITPAHAGKRLTRALRPVTPWDHPRTRGEKLRILRRPRVVLGSPPHTRGKAAAGGMQNAGAVDHPRTRGEKRASFQMVLASIGSPPHTRGKVFLALVFKGALRITPAHAGKRQKTSFHILEYGITPAHAGKRLKRSP